MYLPFLFSDENCQALCEGDGKHMLQGDRPEIGKIIQNTLL